MKYTFDYSGEFNESIKLFDTETDEIQIEYPFTLADAKQQLPILNVEKLKLFDEIFRLLNCAARVHGATIDVLIDENEFVGKIRLKCAEFNIILGDEDVIRRALVFALKKSDTVVVQSVEDRVAVTITVSLKKYLTN